MGFSGRKYFLPAPTDSLTGSNVDGGAGVSEDIATDLSRRTDRTSYTIPDDSTPVTITVPTKKKTSNTAKSGNSSRTSLLIEVYESVDKDHRTSLRVRLPPAGESRATKGGTISNISSGVQQPAYIRKIPLTKQSLEKHGDQEEADEVSEIEVSAPVDIGGATKASDISGLSQYPELQYYEPGSEVSSMPGESYLGTRNPTVAIQQPATSSVLSKSDLPRSVISDMPDSNSDLKPPVLKPELNLSHERITQKAIEKLSSKDRVSTKSSRRHSDKSRSRSSGGVVASASGERRRKSSKHYGEESSLSTGTEPSQVSNSVVSAGARSTASGASNITNPKLLQTVEDAIRRLILPELREIKRHGSQRHSYREDEYSDVSENSIAREKERSHRVSSGSKSRRKSGRSHETGARRRSQNDYDYDSESVSSVSDHKHRNRDLVATSAAAAAVAGAALQHQDSSSTLDHNEERRRRRKRSKSRSSRSASVNESEEIFSRHDVPPMPFVSEVNSDLTRSSILSSNTANTATPTQRDVRDVIRGSPMAGVHSQPQTPTRTSGDLRHSLGLHHRNVSGHDLGTTKEVYHSQPDSPVSPEADFTPETVREIPYRSSPIISDPERMKLYEQNLHQQHPIRRGLSPIASVASYATTEPARNSIMQPRSMDSIESAKAHQQPLREEVSAESFSSASPDFKKNIGSRDVGLFPGYPPPREHDRGSVEEYDDDDDMSSRTDDYRDSYSTSDDLKKNVRPLTHYTDDSVDPPILDKAGSGQQVTRGVAANPEYVDLPSGVESAVASLIEPSVIDTPVSPQHSIPASTHSQGSLHSGTRGFHDIQGQMSGQGFGSATKLRQFDSPPQSPAASSEHNIGGVVHEPAPVEQKSEDTPESEIDTNPSVIQGPIGGLVGSNHDHWPYAPTPDRTMHNLPAQQALDRDLGMQAEDLVPPALNVSQRYGYTVNHPSYPMTTATPPGHKDEGYATGDTGNHRSPGPYAKQADRGVTPDELEIEEDPFTTKANKYTSGLSQGMSPLYDAATGRGIDRIQSKDIVALMDHLTVRDAQRNARDTEILVTLVRSAAEMRNQFEDMKKFISEQDDLLMGAGERQHEKTQKVIGGPRPFPSNRSVQRTVASQDDIPSKRRNIFQRAVQRLGAKNDTELQNIEQMLMQLLHDVEDLRTAQASMDGPRSVPLSQPTRSINVSADNIRVPTDPGYEPEGQAGTSSTGDRSGLLSGSSSRQAEYHAPNIRKEPGQRVSTVEEDEEEYNDYDNQEDDHSTPRGSPAPNGMYHQSQSQALSMQTPPKLQSRLSEPWSGDNNPQYTYEPSSAGKKHKSTASSFFGKGFMSRWSKTTASTMPDNRQSTQKPRPYSQVSQSGSDLAGYQYEPQAEDQLPALPGQEEYYDQDYDENRPPSPLVPSQVSENPKYQGYRNSQNLQHPQPRQGPTGRYQHHLESEAITYKDQFSPTSQTSSHWEAHANITNVNDFQHYAPQPPLSPISDGGYSSRSSTRGHSRPSKGIDNDPLIPQRSTMSPSTYVEHVAAARGGSPAYLKSPVQPLRSHPVTQTHRKPSGPRPLSSSGSTSTAKPIKGDLNAVKRTRFRGSPYHIDSEEDLHKRQI